MNLKVCDGLLHFEVVLSHFLFDLLGLNTYLEHFVNDLLQVFNKVVVLGLHVFVRFVDDVDKHLPVVLQRFPQSLQVVVHLYTLFRKLLTNSEN